MSLLYTHYTAYDLIELYLPSANYIFYINEHKRWRASQTKSSLELPVHLYDVYIPTLMTGLAKLVHIVQPKTPYAL